MKGPIYFIGIFAIVAIFLMIIIQISGTLSNNTLAGCYENETGGVQNCSLSDADYYAAKNLDNTMTGNINILTILLWLIAILGLISGIYLFSKILKNH
jgi:hypothetical protein